MRTLWALSVIYVFLALQAWISLDIRAYRVSRTRFLLMGSRALRARKVQRHLVEWVKQNGLWHVCWTMRGDSSPSLVSVLPPERQIGLYIGVSLASVAAAGLCCLCIYANTIKATTMAKRQENLNKLEALAKLEKRSKLFR